MMPLYGFLQGDCLGLLILADDGDTVSALAQKLIQSASVRVAVMGEPRVVFRKMILDSRATLASVGMSALDRFDVVWGPSHV
jgi:hypothetical protein